MLKKPFISDKDMIEKALEKQGILVEPSTGHIRYHADFRPLSPSYEIVFVRHGETYGNCGQVTPDGKVDATAPKDHSKRIYQGNVDMPINQLTPLGQTQATKAAERLENELLKNGWKPDVIFHSPLSRARDTGLPFVIKFNYEKIYFPLPESREMSFGSWDNRRVCDLPENDPCHLFYRDQNTVVKNSGINGNGKQHAGENFCEVLLRARSVLENLEKDYAGKKIILFSHSMFGAACSILLGKGQTAENGDYLAFDGQRKDGTHYIMPNATPFLLNFTLNTTLAPSL